VLADDNFQMFNFFEELVALLVPVLEVKPSAYRPNLHCGIASLWIGEVEVLDMDLPFGAFAGLVVYALRGDGADEKPSGLTLQPIDVFASKNTIENAAQRTGNQR